MFRELLALSLSDRDPGRSVNYAGDGVLEISSKDGENVRLQVDEKTGIPLKLSYQEAGPQGPAAMDQVYSDWREVSGVRVPFAWSVMQGGQEIRRSEDSRIQDQLRPDRGGAQQEAMRFRHIAALVFTGALVAHAETSQERGKRLIDDCVQALGGDSYMHMQTRVESGRAYSFYREDLSGLSRATIYTRYSTDVTDTAHQLAQRQRQNFGKKEDYGVLFGDKEAWDVTFRGARPLPDDSFDRYRETTLRDVFYILRVRLHEPGMIFEARGADVIQNVPVEIVDITDADNLTTTVYLHQGTKLPVRQVFYRRDPKTRQRNEEITLFSKYRDVGGGVQWPYAIERHRNGEKIFQIFSESVEVNSKQVTDDMFVLPSSIKMLKPL